MGRSKLLEVSSQHQSILFGFQNKSLIQICSETHDEDSWELLMQKIVKDGSYVNLETLNLFLKHEDTCYGFEYLSKLQVTDSEFNNRAKEKLPIMGKLKKTYLFSEEILINPDMIADTVE